MANLSQIRREQMLSFLETLKEQHSDDESLIAINQIERELTAKKYGLVWEEHEEEVDEKMKTHIPVFTEDVSKEIVGNPDSDDFNFLLEGDNLHSLKLLEKTHKGLIDIIYLDPPYNTGSDGFKYDDNYVVEEDSFRHSKWLSFMKRRLSIARNLLSDTGAIFIQISDIECAQLKLLCDEIFGESNFLNIININMKNIAGASGGGEDKRFKKNCEYLIVYAKNYDLLPVFNGAYDYEEIGDLVERYREEGISWKYTSALVDSGDKVYVGSTVDGDGNEIRIYRRDNYLIKSIGSIMKDEKISEKEAYSKYSKVIFQTAMPQSSIRPRVMEKVKEIGIDSDLYSIEYVPKTGRNKGKVYEQFYKGDNFRLFAWLSDVSEEIDGKLYKKTLQGTYWNYASETKNLTKEGNVEFPNGKKPLALLERIIELHPSKDAIIMDFFAGSGTTGHAVLECNNKDNGNRQFILCTNNENNICEEITYQRLNNCINGYVNEKGKQYPGLKGNLKYYSTSFISKESEELVDDLLEHIVEMIQLQFGVKVDNEKYVIIMDDEEMDEFEKNIANYDKLEAVFINQDVLLSTSQEKMLEKVNTYIIPDCYFDFELREAGELW